MRFGRTFAPLSLQKHPCIRAWLLAGWELVVGYSLVAGGGGLGFRAAEGALSDPGVVTKFFQRGLDFFDLLAMSTLAGKIGHAAGVFRGIVSKNEQGYQRVRV